VDPHIYIWMEENSNNSFYYSLSDMKNLKNSFRDTIIENRRVKNEKMLFPTHLYIHNVSSNNKSSRIDKKSHSSSNLLEHEKTFEPSCGGALIAKPVNLLCPSDREKKVLAIDLGGSFLKLCVYKLRNDEIVSHTQLKKYKISKDGSLSNVSMFDWIAAKTQDFLMGEFKEKTVCIDKSNLTLSRLIDDEFYEQYDSWNDNFLSNTTLCAK
ncbi:putative Hexokinase, partial [Trachipleistophora hominis]